MRKFILIWFFLVGLVPINRETYPVNVNHVNAESVEENQSSFKLYSVDPWCRREADQLQDKLKPDKIIELEGMLNDWLVTSAVVMADETSELSVHLESPEGFQASLKVVGEVMGQGIDRKFGWWLDPVFEAPLSRLGDLSADIRNWDTIKDFPQIHLNPHHPIMLWITFGTHEVSPDTGIFHLIVIDEKGNQDELTIRVQVHPVKLPFKNPQFGYGWQRVLDDRKKALLIRDYGFNVCGYYENWDMCRELGFRYFKFNFPLCSSLPESLKCSDEEIQYYLEEIRNTVNRLNLQDEEWGIEIFDEPSDLNSSIYVAWMKRMRSLWKDVRFWANPGYNLPDGIPTVQGTVEPFEPYVSTWCPYIDNLKTILPAIKKTRGRIWYYIITYIYARPDTGGRSLPWYTWWMGLDGWAFYSLDAYGNSNPWRDNVCVRLYPGYTASLWLEGLRQGVQDYKRLWLLRQSGMEESELREWVRSLLIPREDSPWGGADPEVYVKFRHELDKALLRF